MTAEAWMQRLGGPELPAIRFPEPHEVQTGYWLTGEERIIRGRANRLFTFAHGCRDLERAVLCIPPLACTGRIFAPMAPLSRDHRLVMWTPPVPRRTARGTDDVAVLADPEFPLPEHFPVVAAGLGCRTALQFAAAHPSRVRSLALISPVLTRAQVQWAAPFHLGLLGLPNASARALAPLGLAPPGSRRIPEPALLELFRQARRFGVREVLARLREAWRTSLPDPASLPRVPTFVLFGAYDGFCDQGSLRDLLKRLGASTEVLDDAGHLPFLSHPVWVNARLQSFLARHD
jgi:pimeloyl-ACP methyl ester carboxylesterase